MKGVVVLLSSYACLALGAMLSPALATTSVTEVTVGAGPLDVAPFAIDAFPQVVLDGAPQETRAPIDTLAVTDARGCGTGWQLTIQATRFAEWDVSTHSYVDSGATLPGGSLWAPTFAVAASSTSGAPPRVASEPLPIDVADPVAIAVAAPATGMGSYELRPNGPLALTVGADAEIATYRSEVTLSLVAGP